MIRFCRISATTVEQCEYLSYLVQEVPHLLAARSCPSFPLSGEPTTNRQFSCKIFDATSTAAHIVTKTAGTGEGPTSPIASQI